MPGATVEHQGDKESTSAEKLLFVLGSVQKSDFNNLSPQTVVSCLSTWGLTLNHQCVDNLNSPGV